MSAGIPPVKGVPPTVARILEPMKENIERLRGRLPKQARLKKLDANAGTDQVVAKINELVELLQG